MVGNRTHLLYNFYVFFQNSHKMVTFFFLYPILSSPNVKKLMNKFI